MLNKPAGKLLAEALKQLKKVGYSGFKISALVDDLDLTRGAAYWHFKDKDDLLVKTLVHYAISPKADKFLTQASSPEEPDPEIPVRQ